MDFVLKHCAKEFEAINALINQIGESNDPFVREITSYISTNRGKRLRPGIVILASQLFGYQGTNHIHAAAAIEILHTATLIHDDIIDNADMRRGMPSINARWGSSIAILMADYYFSKAFTIILSAGIQKFVELLCQVATLMCEGELIQQRLNGKFPTRADYFRIIKHKTAYLFSTSAQLGAVAAGASDKDICRMRNYGLNLGMAFQISDDILDYCATDKNWGKTPGSDLRQGHQTLPFIYAFEAATPNHQKELRMHCHDETHLHKMVNIIKKYNGFEYSGKVARYFVSLAKKSLSEIPDSEAKSLLLLTADCISTRTF